MIPEEHSAPSSLWVRLDRGDNVEESANDKVHRKQDSHDAGGEQRIGEECNAAEAFQPPIASMSRPLPRLPAGRPKCPDRGHERAPLTECPPTPELTEDIAGSPRSRGPFHGQSGGDALSAEERSQ